MNNIIDITPYRGKHEGKIIAQRIADREALRQEYVDEIAELFKGKTLAEKLEIINNRQRKQIGDDFYKDALINPILGEHARIAEDE